MQIPGPARKLKLVTLNNLVMLAKWLGFLAKRRQLVKVISAGRHTVGLKVSQKVQKY